MFQKDSSMDVSHNIWQQRDAENPDLIYWNHIHIYSCPIKKKNWQQKETWTTYDTCDLWISQVTSREISAQWFPAAYS